ncbi:MAG: class II aldolase [Thermomicrobiales bacterium]|nr:MAG: class II aldolase [Thermomicrobiales bacterium]
MRTAMPALGQTLHEQVAWACRILAMRGHGDFTLGHVSARDGDRVHMKRNGIGLEEVTPADVLTIDLDGRKIAGEGRVHLEAVLHTEVYRARPDVGCVIHTHPLYTTALAATDGQLELLNHDAVLFKDGLAIFEETAELIQDPVQGAAVARALGNKRAVLLRGHGVLIVGSTVPWAVYTALTLERVVQIQAIARALGEPRPMSPEMADRVYPDKYRDEYLNTYWQYLIRQVRRAGLDDGMPRPLLEDTYAPPIRHP